MLNNFLLLTLMLMLNLACAKPIVGPVNWDLSPEAELTYATILIDQSIRQGDQAGIMEAADIFMKQGSDSQAIIDATAWLIINKQVHTAKDLLNQALKKFPQDLGLRLLLAETWLESNEPEQAVQVLLDFQKIAPDSELVRQELAILHVKAGHFTEANRIFKKLPQRLRTSYVRFCHAQALVGLHDLAGAKTQLRLALEENTEFLEAWYELAKILEQENNYKEASKIYQSLTEQEPDNLDLWSRMIGLELQAKRPRQALQQLQKAPPSIGFRLSVASKLIELKYYAEAKELLQAMHQEPNAPPEINFFLAALLFEAENDAITAIALLNNVPSNNRFFSKANSLKIQILYNQGDRNQALSLIQSGRNQNPQDQDLLLMEIQFYLDQNDQAQALKVLEQGLETWSTDPNLLFMRGSLLDSLGQKEAALKFILELWQSGNKTPQVLNYIGYAYAEQGINLPLALELIQEALAQSPDKAYIIDSLAWVQYKLGQLNAAWKNIKHAILLEKSDPTIWDHYGDIAHKLGYTQESKQAWQKALTLNPDQPAAIELKLKNLTP